MSRRSEPRRAPVRARGPGVAAVTGIHAALAAALMAALLTLPAFAAPPRAAPKYGFGQAPTPEQVAAWDIDVRPDGKGLPPGRGTVADGQGIYDAKCASCHGTFGESTDYMVIAGGVGSLKTDQPMRTTGSKLAHATTLWDYINRAMPFTNPKTLTPDEVYALTAYVLHLSDILPADAVLDRESLPKLKLPNRDGFTTDHGFMRRDGKPDVMNTLCMTNCVAEVRLSSEYPDYARDSHGNLAEQTRDLGPVEGSGASRGARSAPKVAAAGATGAAAPAKAAAATTSDPAALVKQAGCTACHAVASRVVGPGFREIATRYAGDGAAEARLAAKVRAGGVGAWGQIPMPPQAQVQETDARAMVQWILGGAK
jgi:S-disulfanyl-L-cysteine oxidoreductase SoxD